MSHDSMFRAAAVAAAAALLAAPYWPQIQAAAHRAMEAGKENAGLIGRFVAAALLIAAAWGKVPLPTLPTSPVAPVAVETPGAEMQLSVKPVAEAFTSAPMSDRILWAHLWEKAAVVVDGDAVMGEVVFTDTRSLRAFVVLSLEIGWRRIGGNQPGKYTGLREATESAFANVIGKDVVQVTPELRKRFADLCRAIAWAALPPRG